MLARTYGYTPTEDNRHDVSFTSVQEKVGHPNKSAMRVCPDPFFSHHKWVKGLACETSKDEESD